MHFGHWVFEICSSRSTTSRSGGPSKKRLGMPEAGATVELARFVASAHSIHLPAAVLHQAKRALVDWLGVTIGGADEPSVEAMARVVLPMARGESASLLGRSE